MKLKIGTRNSKLAMIQTELAIKIIKENIPNLEFEIIPISTRGDQDKTTPLYAMPSTGVFIKEIEKALLDKEIDIAVHSLKDVNSILDPRFVLLPILFEDKRDALITKNHKTLHTLQKNAIIATSSLRRMACIHHIRPDIQFVNIRGNIETRIKKFKEMDIDGIILAVAGLKRLNLDHQIDEYLDPSIIIPACGQGTIALEIRKEDKDLFSKLSQSSNQTLETKIEREFLSLSKAGCHYPIGCYAKFVDNQLQVYACLGETIEDCKFVSMTFDKIEYNKAASSIYKKIKEENI
ncbi:hydroxymethylbilane synthase [Faecalitalea cylindroides]|uniref:Hydroxymethylbilane synthase n=1 Tax=Faecalitalea cylindroides TaxID=39483 RepID=A0AAW6FQ35_9FIRM|nr:hydroxymethylbilane synthase [Faecalitalea cylindroides]MDC0827322.1 hydroxymethylbilane synthase [Faecalitalea cylindroides]